MESKPLSLFQWRETGRFLNRESFLEKNPSELLHVDCTDVVQYQCGLFIQVLKTGEFHTGVNERSRKLEDIEEILWKNKTN
jgi:hypothetical protein